jgi:hypothetical protein
MPQPDALRVFAHRSNKDGTEDSICLFCFATIASVSDARELEGQESVHFCWQRRETKYSYCNAQHPVH